MKTINRNRFQWLISGLFGFAAIIVGASLAIDAVRDYPRFASNYYKERQTTAVEKKFGMSFGTWQSEQTDRCAKQASEAPDRSGKEMAFYSCMNPTMENVSNVQSRVAYLKELVFPTIAFVLAAIFLTWLSGLLVAKTLPDGALRFWGWLTSGDKG